MPANTARVPASTTRTSSEFEDRVLGALEAHDVTHDAWDDTRKALTPLFQRILSAWLFPGASIDIHARGSAVPRCLWTVRVGSGNARNASHFRITGQPSVTVDFRGNPAASSWAVRAVAISPKTGKEMSGNTPNRRTTTDGSITLTGFAFDDTLADNNLRGQALRRQEREAFLRMVVAAETILAARAAATPASA